MTFKSISIVQTTRHLSLLVITV